MNGFDWNGIIATTLFELKQTENLFLNVSCYIKNVCLQKIHE